MTRPNAPTGWAAFRALRQTAAPIKPARHGNWRHGTRTLEHRHMMRRLRFVGWALRKPGRLMAMPDETLEIWCPPLPAGWKAYAAAANARHRNPDVGEFVGDDLI